MFLSSNIQTTANTRKTSLSRWEISTILATTSKTTERLLSSYSMKYTRQCASAKPQIVLTLYHMPLKIRRFLFFFFFFYFCPFPFLLLSKNLLSLSFFLFFFLLFIFERGAQNIPSCDFSFSKALYTRTRGTLKRRRILEPAFSRDLRLTLSLITNKQMCTCVLFLKTRTSRSDSFQEPHKKAGKADFSATGARLKPPRQISSKIRSFSSDRRRKIQPSLEKSAIKQRKRE